MDAREFRDLLTHMTWADAQTWRAAKAIAAGHDERLRWLFHHIHLVQSVYLQTWRRDPFVVTELSSYPTLAAIEAWARPYYDAADTFAGTLDDARLRAPLEYPWSELILQQFGVVRPTTMGESAWQVFSHTTYHRGQIATRLRELGGEPPLVDYLVWVWGGRPATDWPGLDA
jgi:uncharacterized damage-inducible protein DinB